MKRTYKTSGTGNNIADYTENCITCSNCKGSGTEKVSKEEVYEIMEHVSFERALNVYKEWRLYGEITCGECSGEGSWTIRS